MAGGKEGPLATVIKSHPDCPGIFLCLLLFNSCSLEVSWDVLLTVLTAPPHGQWLCCDSCHCSWVSHILWVFQDFPLHFSQENASQSSVVGWVDASIKRKIIFKEGFILHVASALVSVFIETVSASRWCIFTPAALTIVIHCWDRGLLPGGCLALASNCVICKGLHHFRGLTAWET